MARASRRCCSHHCVCACHGVAYQAPEQFGYPAPVSVIGVRTALGGLLSVALGVASAVVSAEPPTQLAAVDRTTRWVSLPSASAPAPQAEPVRSRKLEYRVRFGDNWDSIAERHGTTRAQLRRWNSEVLRTFAAGTPLTIWVAPDFQPVADTPFGLDRDASGLPLVPVAWGGESVGQPSRGRLLDGVALPDNPALYTIRRPDFAFGSSHAVLNLQLGLAKFRKLSRYAGPLIVSDMSSLRGKSYGPHDSHQSGRDVDIWLPLRNELWAGRGAPRVEDPDSFLAFAAQRAGDVDWDASAELILALIRTGEVQYVFLSRARQKYLYRTLRARGHTVQELGELIQYPRRAQTALVRHASHHDKHIHVRFRCASHERRCL
jgi:murein endopeptidase